MREVLFLSGASIIFIWGIAHIIPTGSVVRSFNLVEVDKRRILTMEWVAEGISLCFIGVMVFLETVLGDKPVSSTQIVYISSASVLILMAVWTLLTGARTSVLPIKICPAVKTLTALLWIIALLL